MANMSHREILEMYDHDWRTDGDNRDQAIEDLRFRAGDQWDKAERQARIKAARPCLTIDRLSPAVNQIANDIRQARPTINALPVDGESDPAIAEIYDGIMRQIQYRSKAHIAYGIGAENAIACGIGHWRVVTDFVDDTVFDQEVRVEPIMDPLAVMWDGDAKMVDRSDAGRCWITDRISRDEYKRRFKGKTGNDIPEGAKSSEEGVFWLETDHVRIAEYWYQKAVERTLAMFENGATVDITDMDRDTVQFLGEPKRTRTVETFDIYRQLIDGRDFLGEPEKWAGRHIPVIPVVGSQVAYDGKVIRSGVIRKAKDAQRLYNLWRSAGAEVVGSSPKAPWLVTFDMIEGLEGYWSNANLSTLPFLPYKIDENAPTLRPERQQPPTPPTAMWQESAIASDDIQATTSIYDASLGAKSNETSGRAIQARDRQGDVGNYHFADNFKASLQRTGEIFVDLIPRIYDAERVIRILGPQDEEQFVAINTAAIAENGEPLLVNDLSHGRFDVRVQMGPSYTTARVEAQERMLDALQSNPSLWGVIGDLVFKNSDYPGSEEVAERIKKTIPPEITGDEEVLAAQQPQPDPLAELAQRVVLEQAAADIDETKAKTEKTLAETRKTEVDTLLGGAEHL